MIYGIQDIHTVPENTAQDLWETYNLLEHFTEAKVILNGSRQIFRQLNPTQRVYILTSLW